MRPLITLLATSLLPSLAVAADVLPRNVPMTGAEVQAACDKVKPCLAQPEPGFEKLAGFCGLAASGKPDAARWAAAVVPTRAELEGKQCDLEAAPTRGLFAKDSLSLPGVNQSALLWGATDFFLGRAELELRQWAIDRFLRSICGDGKYAKLGGEPIFPTSCDVLDDAHLAGFLPGMAMYQEAVRTDFVHLPVLATKHAALNASGTRRDAGLVAMLLAHAIEGQLLGAPPILSLQYAATRVSGVPLACGEVPFASRLFIVASLLASLQPASLSDGALGGAVELPKDELAWSHAFMALAVNATDVETSAMARVWPAGCGAKGFAPAPGAAPFDVAALHGGIDAIRTAVKDAEKASAELQGVPADATAAARAEAYARISARVVAGARGLIAIFPEPTAGRPELARVLDHVERACRDLAGGRYARVALEVAGVSAYIAAKELMPQAQFLRVTSFAADVAQAGTAEQAAAAIERFAAPPGGYLRKRRGGRWYGTVNGYVGGSGAWELAKQASGGWSGARWGFAPGFWVPVGIEGGIAFKGTSLGLLAYPIDLGVLASWRVKNDDLEARPVVGTEQVFAPGGAIVWGIPRAPITVAASVSLAPRLRVVEEPGQADRERNALRVGLNLAVDIPIFP